MNIGGSEETTISDLAERVIALTGSSSRIVHVPYHEAYLPGFEDVRRRVPDTDSPANWCRSRLATTSTPSSSQWPTLTGAGR